MQEKATAEVEAEPEELGGDDGAAGQRHGAEEELAEGWVDGGDFGVVDFPVPGGAQRGEGFVAGWMGVGTDALREDMAVPEVAVDVVG